MYNWWKLLDRTHLVELFGEGESAFRKGSVQGDCQSAAGQVLSGRTLRIVDIDWQ